MAGKNKKHAMTKSRIAFALAGLALVVLIGVIGFLLLSYDRAANIDPSPNNETEVAQDDDAFPYVDWEYWQDVNPDVIGWVTVPETPINYPIVQAPKNAPAYYLQHDIYKNYNVFGCPYLDAECNGFDTQNTVIFGHHMNDGSMFSAFASFSDRSVSENATILLQTPKWKKTIAVDGVDIIDGWAALKRVTFNDQTDFHIYRQTCLDDSILRFADSGENLNQMYTFCTCSYDYGSWNERTLIYGSTEK